MEDLNLVLRTRIDDSNKSVSEINNQIKELNTKIKALKISIEVDDKVIKSLNDKIDEIKKHFNAGLKFKVDDSELEKTQLKVQKIFGTSIKFNPQIDSQGINDFKQRVKEIRADIDELAKVEINTTKNGNIKSALITYKNEMGQVVQETMEWQNHLNKAGDILKRVFTTTNVKYVDNLEKANKELEKQNKNLLTQEKYFNNIDIKVLKLKENISNLKITKGLDTSNFTKDLENIDRLISNMKNMDFTSDIYKESKVSLDRMVKSLEYKLTLDKNELDRLAKKENIYANIEKQLANLKDITVKNDKYDKSQYNQLVSDFNRIKTAVENGTMSFTDADVELKKLSATTKNFEVNAKSASNTTNAFSDTFKRFVSYFSIYRAIQLTTRAIREITSTVTKLDTALYNIQMVTDGTREETVKLMESYSKLGKELGATTLEVATSANEFLRQGNSLAETTALIENAMILSKVGMLSSADATTYLTSAMKGFNIEASDTLSIVDKLASVDMKAAVSAGGLAEGMSRTASSAKLAGIEMDKLIGYLATVGEVTQKNMGSIGESFKTIFSRMGNVKLGKLVDEEGEDITTQISDVERVLSKVNIQLRTSATEFRNFGDVLDEVGTNWDKFNDVEKNAIATTFAGMRQRENFLVLMENYGNALKYTEVALGSAGTAMNKFEVYQESIEARTKKLTVAFEEMANKTINSGLIKWLLDFATGVLTLITNMGGLIPILTSVGLILLGWKTNIIPTLIGQIEMLILAQTGYTVSTVSAAIAQVGLTGAIQATIVAMKSFLLTNPVGWAILAVSAVASVIAIFNKLEERAEKAAEKVAKFSEELADLQKEQKSLSSLSQRYFELKDIDKTNEQLEEYYNLQNQIKEILPSVNGYHDEHGNFIISEDENLRSLNKTYEKYIKNKRQELALAAEESNKYILKDYNAQKARIELLKQYEELVKKQTAGTLNTSDIEQLTYLQNILGIPLTESAIKKAFKEANSIINNSLDELQNNIRNTLLASDEWESIVSSELKNSLLKALPEMSVEVLLEYSEALSGGTFDVKEFINALKDLAKQSEKTKEAIKIQKTEHEKLQEAYKKGNITLAEYTEELHKLDSVTDTYKKEVSNLGIALEYLNGILDKVTKNQSLTKDEVEKLISLYPDLKNAIYETVDGWTVEENVLSLLITTIDDLKTSYINAQTAITIAMSNQVVTRLKITETELKSIQSTIDAYNLIGSKLGGLDTGSARGEKFLEKSYLSGTKSNLYSAIIDIGKLQDEIKSMQGSVLKDLNLASLGADKSSSKTTTDEIIENFKKQYKELQYLRDKDLISAQEYYDRLNALVNDTFTKNGIIIDKYLDEFRQYDVELYNLLTNIIEANAAASVEALEKELKKLTDGKIIIELQQQLVGKNTDEYLKFEKEKYTNILEQENALQKAIGELQKQGTKVALEEADKLITSYYELVRERYNIIANLQSIQVSIYKEQISALENQKKALSDLHKYTMDMIKAEYDAKKKSLQEELKGIEDIFNAKKKALRDEKDLYDYTKGLKEKTSLVADLENQLAIIKNDETAIKKRKELEEKLSKAKEELTEYQYKHSLETQEKLLDEELENQKDKFQKEIDELDDVLSNEVKLRELADKRIAKSGEKLYNQLISYSKQYGKITEDEIKDAWDNANISLQGFKSTQEEVLETLEKITIELNKIEKLDTGTYASTSGYDTSSYNDKIQQMKLNSAKWTASGDDERRRLAEENQKLGKSLGLTYDSSIGAWFWDKEKKYRVYHGGGIVGGSGYATKSTEELAKLAKGELVINKPQADKIMENVTNNSNEKIEINMPIVIEGNADKSTVDLLKEQANRIAEMVAKEFNKSKTNTGWKKPVRV